MENRRHVKFRSYVELEYNNSYIYSIDTGESDVHIIEPANEIDEENGYKVMTLTPSVVALGLSNNKMPRVFLALKEWNKKLRGFYEKVGYFPYGGIVIASEVVQRDGKTVIDLGIAHCSDKDVFDPEIGQKIAWNRLNDKNEDKFGFLSVEVDFAQGRVTHVVNVAIENYLNSSPWKLFNHRNIYIVDRLN